MTGQDKIKKKTGHGMGPALLEVEKEERSLHSGSPLAGREIRLLDRKRASEAPRRAQQPVCNRQNRENHAEGAYTSTL